MWSDIEILAKMPCWYFDRKQIKNSPSFLSGIDTNTENRYRREGARFIIDAGTKMGLRWDTCATGVVYFHRFYMFHSFKEFYRYVTAACCLFLAGKVEETPKKCKDVIKIAQNLLSSASFAKFGDDPREEVMTMERILLKTIKFDFNVEHPYSHLLKYAKNFKCEKEKIQNMAQMAWTFINDSLCTTLCLQWEPEIVCISLMYLASRLTKFEPSDWSARTGTKSKWWEDWLEGMSMELMEDICHQVLDLYSNKSKKQATADSPPNSPLKTCKVSPVDSTPPPPPDRPPPTKRIREEVKAEPEPAPKPEVKEKEVKYTASSSKLETESNSSTATSGADDTGTTTGAPIPVAQHRTPTQHRSANNNSSRGESDSYSSYNPYVSSRMFTSSFMSQEGSQNIQSILAGNTAPPSAAPQPVVYPEPPLPSHHGPPDASQYPPPTATVPPPHTSQYTYPPPQSHYAPPPSIPVPHAYPPPSSIPQTYDPYNPPSSNPSYLPPSYSAPPPVSMPSYLPPPTHPPTNSYNYPPPHLPPPSMPPQHPPSYHPPSHPYPPPRPSDPHQGYGGVSRNYSNMSGSNNTRKDIPALTEVKIAGRPDWNMNK